MAFGRAKEVLAAPEEKPFSGASAGLQPDTGQDNKRVSEDDEYFYTIKEEIRSTLVEVIDIEEINELRGDEARTELSRIAREILDRRVGKVPPLLANQIIASVSDDVLGYGPIEELLAMDDVSDIMVNGPHRVFVEIGGKVKKTSVRFKDNNHLLNVCQRIVSQVGRRVDESSPIADARLPDGSRVNVILPPLSIDGPSLTIRKFRKQGITLDRLVEFGSISAEAADILQVIAQTRCNVMISGGTGSGKTTLLNALTAFINDDERIVTCEDAAELQLQQPHTVRLETRPRNLEGEGEVLMRDLVKNCLRMRPDRIIVGEVRGNEAFDLLQAMNTGHDGSMGSLHANSPRDALRRIETMITAAGFQLPVRNIREMIASSVEVIVHMSRLRTGRRVVTHITEVTGMEEDIIQTQDLVRFEMQNDGRGEEIIGFHSGTGIAVPNFWPRATYYGKSEKLSAALDAVNRAQTTVGPH